MLPRPGSKHGPASSSWASLADTRVGHVVTAKTKMENVLCCVMVIDLPRAQSGDWEAALEAAMMPRRGYHPGPLGLLPRLRASGQLAQWQLRPLEASRAPEAEVWGAPCLSRAVPVLLAPASAGSSGDDAFTPHGQNRCLSLRFPGSLRPTEVQLWH